MSRTTTPGGKNRAIGDCDCNSFYRGIKSLTIDVKEEKKKYDIE